MNNNTKARKRLERAAYFKEHKKHRPAQPRTSKRRDEMTGKKW